MFGFLRRLFDWDSHPGSAHHPREERRRAPRTSPGSVLADDPQPYVKPHETPSVDPEEPEEAELTLEDPDYRLKEPTTEDGVNPYDTGAFDKSDAWRKARK